MTQTIEGVRISCYDNGGKTADRFTVVYLDRDYHTHPSRVRQAIGMNAYPFHPQGIGQHCGAIPGQHLGRQIQFEELPEACQQLVRQDLQP